MKKIKLKKCKICKAEFEPFNSIQAWCSPKCGYELSQKKLEAKSKRAEQSFRKETRKRKEALKSKSDWLNDAQKACNAYIRERDKGKGCISCGTTKTGIQYCAGHFKTRGGHPELRFHPMNIFLQCNKRCNLELSGNIAEYRPRLIDRIGIKNVEWLEGKHEIQHLSIPEIKEISAYYKEQTKLLKQER